MEGHEADRHPSKVCHHSSWRYNTEKRTQELGSVGTACAMYSSSSVDSDLARTLSMNSNSDTGSNDIFGTVFCVVWVGAVFVTLNA